MTKSYKNLFFMLLILPFSTLAQSNYKPGYVVNTKGDTVRGFIDYQDWGSNPSAISFKASLNSEKKRFTLHDIILFDIAGFATYKKNTVSVSLDPTNASNIISGRDTSFKIDTVFLKLLQQGKNVALYEYTDAIKTRFYIEDAPDFIPAELTFRLYLDASTNGGGTTVNENTYQKQLFALSNKYKSLDDEQIRLIEGSVYRASDLLEVVSRINNISKAEYNKKYTVHSKIGFYIGAALNISQTTSSSGSAYSSDGGVGYTSKLPSIKAGMNFLPDPNGRVEFRVDVSANFAKVDALYKLTVLPYVPEELSFNQLSVALTPQIIFNIYNSPDFKFYIGVGLAPGVYNYSNPYFGAQNKNTDDDLANQPYNFETVGVPFVLKGGLRIAKRFDIYFDYYTSTQTSNGGYFFLNNQMTQIGVNYFFGN